MKLWLVESPDWDYDEFQDGVVWAETAADAKEQIRKTQDLREGTKLTARPARKTGVVHVHVHFG